MPENNGEIGNELLNLPMGEMIRSIASAVVDAQFKMDKGSMMMAEFMSGKHPLRDPDTGQLIDSDGRPADKPTEIDSRIYFGFDIVDGRRVPRKLSLFELGFTPNLYQFVDTTIEIKLALKVNRAKTTTGAPGEAVITSTPVDAGYSSSYNFNVEAASVFKTRLVPIPAPAILEERLRELMDQEKAGVELPDVETDEQTGTETEEGG